MTDTLAADTPTALAALIADCSLEMTGKDIEALRVARPQIPPDTRVNVTFLGNEDVDMRVAAAAAVTQLGLIAVPHISARRIEAETVLDAFLGALDRAGASDEVFVIGGDPPRPAGPYPDALAVIRSGALQRHGVSRVSIAGYPEGHPEIETATLWSSLESKLAALGSEGLTGDIITQFAFDVDPVLAWVEEVRARGLHAPIRIGVPGPAGVRRLLAYAKRFGVSSGTIIAKKYGLSLTNLMSTAGPERFLEQLAERYAPDRHGELGLHLYTFGGLAATSQWIRDFAMDDRDGS